MMTKLAAEGADRNDITWRPLVAGGVAGICNWGVLYSFFYVIACSRVSAAGRA